MPRKPVIKAAHQYGAVGQVLKLFPHERNTISAEDKTGVWVEVMRAVETGYGNKTQTVLATVKLGRKEIQGKTVILRFYDTVYVSPEQLPTIPFYGTSPRSSYHLMQFTHMYHPAPE
jgi:hypothetical protein